MTKSKKSKNFGQPDEVRKFKSHGQLEVLDFGDGLTIGKGTMVIRMNDGEQFTIRAGEAFHIPPGHDAWVEGSESCELLDVGGYKDYAKKKAA